MNFTLVTADIVGFYPSISHKAGLKALKNPLGKNEQKHIFIETLIYMVEFVLKKTFLNLMALLNNKFLEWPLVQSVLLLTLVYLWIR